MNTKIIKLDINRRLYDKIVAKQDDTKSRFLLFQLLDGAVPFNLTDRSVRVYGVKPDGAVIFNDLTVTHSATGFCLLELTNQMLAIAGTVKLELMITEGDKKLTSIPFEMEVIKKINSNAAVESSNEFRSLLNALKEIDDWNREFADKSGKLEELYTPRLNELGSQLETKVSKRFEGNIDANLKKIKNLQNPILVTNELYPNEKNKYNVCWADNDSIYAIGGDRMLRKSIDGGITWTKQDTTNRSAISGGIFRKLKNGTLLSCTTSSPIKIMRSVDDGATWTQPLTLDSGVSILGSQGWCEDNNGYVYIAEYHTLDRETNIWISKDYGETWAKLKTFSRAEIRHAHACCLDPWSGKVFITVGDALTECGIYSVNDTYDGVIEIVHSDASMSFQESQRYRAVGLMFFENYIAWGMDGGNSPCLYRLKRSNFGNSQAIENMGRISGVAWWTQRANEENTKWVVSVSNENNYDGDNYGHILLVENEGESIYELATFPNTRDGQYVSMQPIGKGGNRFWLTNYRSSPNFQGSYALSNSFSVLPLPIKDIKYIDKTTISSGVITVPQYGTKTFFIASTQAIASNFIIYNLGVRKLSGNGTARIRILNNQTSGNIFDTSSNNLKTQTTKEGDEFLTEIACVGNSSFEFIAVNTGSEPVELNAYVVYGWEV